MTVDCIVCPIYQKCIASTFGLSELEWFRAKVKRKNLKKGEKIFSENQIAREMYMVVKGNIKFIKDDDLPYPITVSIAHSGELIGIEAVINTPHTASASCISDATLCMFDKSHIQEIIRNHDATCQFLVTELLNHIKNMYKHSLIIISGNSSSRVAQALISLFGSENTINITKEKIALMTGSSRETVSRIISEMKRHKIIDTNQKMINVLNREKLILMTKKTKRKSG